MAAFGVSTFLAVFLFFHAQPLVGLFLLPTFGGGPAVWSVCLVFCQGLLLGGYLWALEVARRDASGAGAAHGAAAAVAEAPRGDVPGPLCTEKGASLLPIIK